jgi:hypothetical protein
VQNEYRINVRFRLNNPDEKQAADYLITLGRSRNQLIVDAVINQIRNQDHAPPLSLSDIRKVVREEFQAAAVVPHTTAKDDAEQPVDISELNTSNIMEDLDKLC